MHTINLIFTIFYTFHFGCVCVYWDTLLESMIYHSESPIYLPTPRILAGMSSTMVHDVIQMADISGQKFRPY